MFGIDLLDELLVEIITGCKIHRPQIITFSNSSALFPLELKHWRGYINEECYSNFLNEQTGQVNILHYYYKTKFNSNCSNIQVAIQSLNDTIIEYLALNNECKSLSLIYDNIHILDHHLEVCFKIDVAMKMVIEQTIEQGFEFGNDKRKRGNIHLTVDSDNESEITNMRINLIKEISINLLKSQGYLVHQEESDKNVIFTIKSSKTKNTYDQCLCGAVLNIHRKKEKILTKNKYVETKMKKVKELNAQKNLNMYTNEISLEDDIKKIANASISFELTSKKITTPVIIKSCDNIDTSIKEASFILYNNVRMNAILNKYAKLLSEKQIPEISSIDECSFSANVWHMVFKYICLFPYKLRTIVKTQPTLEIDIHLLWSFISQLCHDFSRYYRNRRILPVKSSSSIPVSEEDIYLVRALRIVVQKSFLLLEVKQVIKM